MLETAKEVAERYGVAHRTVLKWAKEGTVPVALRVGGVLRFDPDAVADALAEITERELGNWEGGAK